MQLQFSIILFLYAFLISASVVLEMTVLLLLFFFLFFVVFFFFVVVVCFFFFFFFFLLFFFFFFFFVHKNSIFCFSKAIFFFIFHKLTFCRYIAIAQIDFLFLMYIISINSSSSSFYSSSPS